MAKLLETLNVGTLSTELSIIVPVYNGGKYLRPCLDSIVAQAYSNWELLMIDDGSSDGSAAVCDEYASRDSRITVVHKPNGGQAAARNDGVALAKGRYVCFVDCDDWLEPAMYATMIQTLEQQQADIVICGYIEEYATRKKYISADGELTVYDAQDALKLVLEGRIGSYLWSMLFRREVVQEPMLSLNPYEDHATIFKWISHARRVVTLHQAFYHYRQLQTSSLHSYNPKNGNHYFLAIKERYYYIADHHLLPGWEAENRRLYLRGCIKLTRTWPACLTTTVSWGLLSRRFVMSYVAFCQLAVVKSARSITQGCACYWPTSTSMFACCAFRPSLPLAKSVRTKDLSDFNHPIDNSSSY